MSRLQAPSNKVVPSLSRLVVTSSVTVEDLNDPLHLVNEKASSGKQEGWGCMIGDSIYVATGSSTTDPWIKFSGQVGLTSIDNSGYLVVTDTLRTSSSPQVIAEGDSPTILNNAGIMIDDAIPTGRSMFDGSRIQLHTSRDECLVRLTFWAKSSKANGGFSIYADIGEGTPNRIITKAVRMLKGANEYEQYTVDLHMFSKETFIENGAMLYLTAEVGNISLYDMSYYISKK